MSLHCLGRIEASDEDSQDVDLDEIGEPQSGLDDALEGTRDPVPLDGHDLTWYMHAFTGVVHAAHNASVGDEQRLLCGRAITVNLNLTPVLIKLISFRTLYCKRI